THLPPLPHLHHRPPAQQRRGGALQPPARAPPPELAGVRPDAHLVLIAGVQDMMAIACEREESRRRPSPRAGVRGSDRSDLGTLLGEQKPGPDWSAIRYTGGTAINSVTWPGQSSRPLDWDGHLRLQSVNGGERRFFWTGDDQVDWAQTPDGDEYMVY